MKCNLNFFLISTLVLFSSCSARLKTGEETIVSGEAFDKFWTGRQVNRYGDSLSLTDKESQMTSLNKYLNFTVYAEILTQSGAEGKFSFHMHDEKDGSSGGYSVILNSSDYRSGNNQKSGSLAFIRNNFIKTTNDNEWFTLGVSVKANHILVTVNDKLISEYIEPGLPDRITGMEEMVLSKGLIAFEKTNEQGVLIIRNIKLTVLGKNIPVEKDTIFVNDSTGEMLTLLNQQAFPVIDYHAHLKGGLTTEQLSVNGRLNGINYGVAPNCGLNFPVTNDSTLIAYYNEMKSAHVFNAMQCEGREWVKLFSPEPVADFDYIFTDAMTWTDHKGRRMRLWMPEETVIEDEQQFMDMLTSKIVAILSQEPVDIYVNPTFLPPPIAENYDRLWTPERMDKVIKALVDNDVALEINSRYKIPGLAFIKRAKAAGVKFTLGTNNAGKDDLGRLEYSLKIIREAGIETSDMFIPRPAGDKKISKMGLPSKVTG